MSRTSTRAACELLESRTLRNAGDPDPSFGSGGQTTISFPGVPIQVHDVAMQSTGKVIAVGNKGGNLAVVRLNSDGSVDTSFGTSGLFESTRCTAATRVAIQGDNKIVMAVATGAGSDLSVARLTTDGFSFDPQFGSTGIATHPAHYNFSRSRAVAMQSDGKIVAAGFVNTGEDEDFAVLRFNTDGTPDASFDGDGLVTASFGEYDDGAAVAIDYNGTVATNPLFGTIVVAGTERSSFSAAPSRFSVLRLRPTGVLDSALDGDGQLIAPDLSTLGNETATAVLVQPQGKIVVAGTAESSSVTGVADFLMARFQSNGARDNLFGPNGTGVIETDFGDSTDRALAVARGFLGGLLVGGTSNGAQAIAAYTSDGTLDTHFSGDGLLRTNLDGSFGGIATTGSSIAPIRRVVIGGGSRVARYIDVGSLIAIGSFDPNASETGPDPATFVVSRSDRLDTSQRVFFNVSGTATAPSASTRPPPDYNGTNISFPNALFNATFVEIPAGQTFTTVTITPINDTTAEGDETAIFTVAADDGYDISTPSSVTLVIRDNDVTGGPVVTSANFVYDAGPPQRVTFRFNQDVASSVGGNDFSVTGPSGSVPFGFAYDSITDTATLSFSGILPDGNYTARAIAAGITNAQGTPMSADSNLNFFFLNGDANHDRVVDVTDLGILATYWQSTGRTFGQADFSYDGVVNVSDLGILATNWQKSLAAPAPTIAAATAISSHRAFYRRSLLEDVLT